MAQDEPVYTGPGMNAYPPHPFGGMIGLRIVETGEGRAVAEIDVDERHHNPNGVVHGGVLFSLADTSMGAALRSLLAEGQISATIEIQIRYLKSLRSGLVRAETRVRHKGKRIAHFDSEIRNGDGDLVATAAGSFSILDAGAP